MGNGFVWLERNTPSFVSFVRYTPVTVCGGVGGGRREEENRDTTASVFVTGRGSRCATHRSTLLLSVCSYKR